MTAPALVAVQASALRVDPTTRQVYVDGNVLDPPLSVKQFDLLWYLYQNRGRAVSKDEIALHVWSECEGDTYDANIDRMVSGLIVPCSASSKTASAPAKPRISTIAGSGSVTGMISSGGIDRSRIRGRKFLSTMVILFRFCCT